MKYGLALWALMCATHSLAYVVNIGTGTRAVYFRVGDGLITGGNYNSGGTPATGGAVNLVQVSVAAANVGNSVEQTMTGSGRLTSDYDDFAFCNTGQVYLGGFFRLNTTATQNATLRVTAPASLVNATGDTIPISQIRWDSSGNGDTGTQPIAAGTFTGGTQTLATDFLRNTWRESCHTFVYRNQQIPAAGTYNVRVTYTLATP